MAIDPTQHDAGLERDFGTAFRPFLGNIANGLIEAGSEDVTGPDLARWVALVVWISLERLSKQLKINIRPWFAGRWLLNTIAVLLKSINPPDVIKTYWAKAAGKTVDTVWDGIVDGVRLRANDDLTAWGQKMSHADRMKLMTPEAYNKAKAFVDRILGASSEKAKDGEAGSTAELSSFGPELDYDVYLRDLEEGEEAKRQLAAELGPFWYTFGRELPKHAEMVGRASLLGHMKIEEITQALRSDRTSEAVEDPEKPKTKISKQHYKLKILAGFAKERVEARTLTLVDPEKLVEDKDPDPLYLPGRDIVYDRQRELERYVKDEGGSALEQALRPYRTVPLPLAGYWKPLLIIALVALVGLVLALIFARPSLSSVASSRTVTRTRVNGAAPSGLTTNRIRVHKNLNPQH